MNHRSFIVVSVSILMATGRASGQQPSFVKQVRPLLARYCVECHNPQKLKGGLDVTTYKALLDGGNSAPGFVAGKPDESLLVVLCEGQRKPAMPPKKSKQPTRAEVAVLRAWVKAGAPDDTGKVKASLPAIPAQKLLAAPVAAVTYRPDGKLLAASGYQEIYLIDTATGDIVRRLPGLTGPVTALAFSRDGRFLAAAAGDAGQAGVVRVLDMTAGMGPPARSWPAHPDLIHDLQFSPDGKLLATASYDRTIRLWDAASGQEVRLLKDHSDAVYGLAFSPDGQLLASAAADRAVKVWNVATGARLYTLGDSTDWVYAVAWSPDGRHLAAGGVDKSIRVWEAGPTEGKLVLSAFAHDGAILRLAHSADGKTLYSLGEDRLVKAWDAQKLGELREFPAQPDAALALAVRPDQAQLAAGRYDGSLVLLDATTGKPAAQPLPVKLERPEREPNDSPTTGQEVLLPVLLEGTLGRPGDVDYVRFEARAGQQIGVRVAGSLKLEPVVALTDAVGRVLVTGDKQLGYTCEKAGIYAIGIRDREYRGGPDQTYRLHIGDVPVATSVFPLGVQRGTATTIRLEGVHLGSQPTVRVQADGAVGSRLPVRLTAPNGDTVEAPAVEIGEFPDVQPGDTSTIPVPGTANGQLDQPGVTQEWRFQARKGQPLVVEVNARRLGSPLDSTIEILDARGRPVPRATLRCLAKTYTTFRDHDSATPNIRLEAWNELAINDYVWVGTELLRIRQLPLHPDADCSFFSVNGQRAGYLDTTPTHHSAGEPMYKVAIHPPGTAFPPNGLPVIALTYRNDDGGAGLGKDSRLFFHPPTDGTYQVRIADARGLGGPAFGYRLTVRPPRPDFAVRLSPASPMVWKGGAIPMTVAVDRLDGFASEIRVRLDNLPPGFSAPATAVPAGELSTAFALSADHDARPPAEMQMLRLIAEATIGGSTVTHEAAVAMPKPVEPGDIQTSTTQARVAVRPGQSVWLKVQIERRGDFKGRVPLDVRGLPHGVRVLNIGLNGVLITEKETSRAIEIYCEPWVQPMAHPIVVLARREGKNSEHAARSVLLEVQE